jgi:hypothetical protein
MGNRLVRLDNNFELKVMKSSAGLRSNSVVQQKAPFICVWPILQGI